MFELLTKEAQLAHSLAVEEARAHRQNSISTGHLLLGLTAQDGVAAHVLQQMGITPSVIRTQVQRYVNIGEMAPAGHYIPYTAACREVMKLAAEEADRLEHAAISSGHILLGLIAQDGSPEARLLQSLGLDLDKTRHQVRVVIEEFSVGDGKRWLDPSEGEEPAPPGV